MHPCQQKGFAIASTCQPRLPLADATFAVCFTVSSTLSGRRFMSDLREAKMKGFIAHVPRFYSIFNYLENPSLTPLLRALITESSLPPVGHGGILFRRQVQEQLALVEQGEDPMQVFGDRQAYGWTPCGFPGTVMSHSALHRTGRSFLQRAR